MSGTLQPIEQRIKSWTKTKHGKVRRKQSVHIKFSKYKGSCLIKEVGLMAIYLLYNANYFRQPTCCSHERNTCQYNKSQLPTIVERDGQCSHQAKQRLYYNSNTYTSCLNKKTSFDKLYMNIFVL